jgi:outer membrane lipoprotein LolB
LKSRSGSGVPLRALGGAAQSALALALALGLTLSGCKTMAPVAAPSADTLNYSGKFALHVTGTERQQSMSGRFALTVVRGEVTLDLSTALGTTMARIRSGPDGAMVTLPDHGALRTEQGADANELSQRVLGWALPVSGIGDWIEGRPAEGRPYHWGTGDNGAALLQQDGWTIRIDSRDADGRVRRLDLDRDAVGEAPAVSLRVVLDPGARG